MSVNPSIIVHGGAWAIPDKLAERSRRGVQAAVRRGHEVLQHGSSAVDAVQAAVVSMEDDTAFDAGTGSVLNANGEVEMDAVIMDGAALRTGAVACVQNIANPVKLARLVMDKTEHTLLVGKGANQFAQEAGIPEVDPGTLVTEEAREDFETFLKFKKAVHVSFRSREGGGGHDTVGAAALDSRGNVAFATSTGGITAKLPGRVGDSPIVGSGGYADNTTGAVSCTGHGESIAKVCLAHAVNNRMAEGVTCQEACEESLKHMSSRVGGSGGVIAVGRDGSLGHSFTTERMAWAYIKDDTLHSGLNPGEDFTERL